MSLIWLVIGILAGCLVSSRCHWRAGVGLARSASPLIRTDAAGRVSDANEAAAALFGAPVSELLGQRVQVGDDIAWSERLAAIAELAGGIAHELRNPLTAARNAAQLGLMFADPTKKDGLFEEVISQADKLNEAIDDLTTFTVADPGPLAPVRLDQVLAAALAQIKGMLIMRNIKVDCAFHGSVPSILGHEHQLKQAILNIFHNSLRAMADGGALIIRTRQLSDPKQLELVIGDTGAGIAPQAVPRLFRPFSGSGQGGSNIGLTIANQIIVQGHNGTITCQSSIGGGTRIRVLLPVSGDQARPGGGSRLSAGNNA